MSKLLFFKAEVSGYTRKDGVNVAPYSTRRPGSRGDASKQLALFARPKPVIEPGKFRGVDPVAATPDMFHELDDLIAEHKRLVGVLRSPSHEDDLREADRQEKELKKYKKQRGS